MRSKHRDGKSIHWRTPTFLFTSLISGIGFAIAHHVFYQSLNGQVVPDLALLFLLGDTLDVRLQVPDILKGTVDAKTAKVRVQFDAPQRA